MGWRASRLFGRREHLLYRAWRGTLRPRTPCLWGRDPPHQSLALLQGPRASLHSPSLPAWGWVAREGRHLPLPNQELISAHFGEDSASYEAEIRELEDLRQVGGLFLPPDPAPPHPAALHLGD